MRQEKKNANRRFGRIVTALSTALVIVTTVTVSTVVVTLAAPPLQQKIADSVNTGIMRSIGQDDTEELSASEQIAEEPVITNAGRNLAQVEKLVYVTDEETVTVSEEDTAPTETVSQTTVVAPVETVAQPVAVTTADAVTQTTSATSAYIDGIVPINQNPELPTGCEVTALTMALNYAGYPADKLTLANNYLNKAWPGEGINPYQYFIGDPTTSSSYGCYAQVITDCAVSYGATAYNISGCAFEDLFAQIDAGQPVLVWGTMNMVPTGCGSYVYTRPDGASENWKSHEHCLLMVGYDRTANTVSLADPLKGAVVDYDLSVFQARWNEQGCQAVIVLQAF